VMMLLQLSDRVVVGETVRHDGDASSYSYYEWVKSLTIHVTEMSDNTSYKCTVRTRRLSNSADYTFTIVGESLLPLSVSHFYRCR